MRKQSFVLAILVGWLVALSPWVGEAQAQNTLLSSSANITSYNAPNPRGTTYFNQNFPLNLVAGNVYTVLTATTVTPNYSVDTYIYLLSPTGSTVASNDDWGSLPNYYGSKITYTPTVSGSYILVVTTFSSNKSYSGVPVTVTFTNPNQIPPGGIPNVKLAPPTAERSPLYAILERPQSRVSAILLGAHHRQIAVSSRPSDI
jgi:hypothetical protein